jgi:hypothetical protein
MLRLAISALFGITLFAAPFFGAEYALAADDTQTGYSTTAQPQNLEFAGIKPTFDIAQFDSESVLRAVFMTAVLGFVIFGRSAPRSQQPEPYVRSSASYFPMDMPTPMSVPSVAGMSSPPLPEFAVAQARIAEPPVPPALDDAQETIVWVNTRTGVVHERGTRWFGKTAEGEYVTKRSLAHAKDFAELSPAA